MQKSHHTLNKKHRRYLVTYRELPFRGIGKEYMFAKSKSEIVEKFSGMKTIEILDIVFVGFRVFR